MTFSNTTNLLHFSTPLVMMPSISYKSSDVHVHLVVDLSGEIPVVDRMPAVAQAAML